MSREPLGPQAREQLLEIARRLQRLTQDFSDPRRFYQRRDDLADEIHKIAGPRR